MREFRFALRRTVPVLCGYVFLGLAFGLLLQQAGFGPLWALGCSVLVYAGSMQFVLVDLMRAGASLLTCALMTLSVNSRHLFYGISFVEKFRSFGAARPYLVYSLSDETYSLLCSLKTLPELSEKRVMVWIAALDQLWWVLGSVCGAALGQVLPFDLTGIDYAMTALFVTILTEQWLTAEDHFPAVFGLGCGAVCLLVLGPDRFLIPALAAAAAGLWLRQGRPGEAGGQAAKAAAQEPRPAQAGPAGPPEKAAPAQPAASPENTAGDPARQTEVQP